MWLFKVNVKIRYLNDFQKHIWFKIGNDSHAIVSFGKPL